MNRPARFLWLVLICALPSVARTDFASAAGTTAADEAAWQRYLPMVRESTLDGPASEPFLLKVEYQLYDLDGSPTERGTAEESWSEGDGKHIRIQSPSLTIGDGPSADMDAAYKRESYLVHQALNAIARPFPSEIERKGFAPDGFSRTVGGRELQCFSPVRPGTTRAANDDVYCSDADNRIVWMSGRLFVLERSSFRKYLNHEIPTDLSLSYEGRPALTMHVMELEPLTDPQGFNSKAKLALEPARVPAQAISALAQKQPKYPGLARAAHIQGEVMISAIISKEGAIAEMDAIASPHKMLTKAAMDAVRTWRYQRYLLNGVATEVETTIYVKFTFEK